MKVEKLTKEQEADIIPHRDFWLNYILSCKNRTDREKATEGINWLYKYCGKKPPVIIWMDSPYGVQVTANLLDKPNIRGNIRGNIGANIRGNIWGNIGANIWGNIRGNIWDNIWDNIGANILGNIGDNIGANILGNIGDNIGANIWGNIGANILGNIGDNIGANNLKYHPTSYHGNISDYGWVAWVDYYIKHNLIKTDKENDFLEFKNLILSGVYDMVQFDAVCIVSDMPTKIIRNQSGRLHNLMGTAIEFKDGYSQHYINGRYISPEVFEKAQSGKLTKKEFIQEKNSDIKGAWYEILGQKMMMDLLGAKEADARKIVHANGDLETVTLLKTTEVFEEIDNQPFAWVKMVCPSTGTQYLQGVEPHHTNALEAIASLSPLSAKDYSFNFRS